MEKRRKITKVLWLYWNFLVKGDSFVDSSYETLSQILWDSFETMSVHGQHVWQSELVMYLIIEFLKVKKLINRPKK